jgi:phenylacetate-CoA ligase
MQLQNLRSQVPQFVWPVIPDQAGAMTAAMLYQLELSQWYSTEFLTWLQLQQAEVLLRHACDTSPYYQQLFRSVAPFDKWDSLDQWRKLPLLSRENLLNRRDDLLCSHNFANHGEVFEKVTSGSTGKQLKIADTDANNLLWLAITMREHHWHQRDFSGRLMVIRSGRYEKDPCAVQHAPNWGEPVCHMYNTGPSTLLFHTMPISQQADVLLELRPQYLLAYPSNILRLAQYFRANALELDSLLGLITYGELMLSEVRQDALDVWGVPIADIYSCEEVGYIALQCPNSEHYHCQSEAVIVEVLDEDGNPCVAGQIGRIVLTSLHNFAMPLIRYENRDYAEVGEPCPCGRGGLTLKRVLGRDRNRAIGRDGKKFWPNISRKAWSVIDGIEELQLLQQSLEHIEVRVVRSETLGASQEKMLANALNDALCQAYDFSFSYHADITRQLNGKYERFLRTFD